MLLTIHRHDNADNPDRIKNVLDEKVWIILVLFPCHPRARKTLGSLGFELAGDGVVSPSIAPLVKIAPPVGYLDMIALEKHARLILTDSGGVQKEAFWLGIPCVTLREETEWPETVKFGVNILAGTDSEKIVQAIRWLETAGFPDSVDRAVYGDGHTAEKICHILAG